MGRNTKVLIVLLSATVMVLGLVLVGCGKKAEPKISSVTPGSGEAGDQVEIGGTDFGETQGTVQFDGESAQAASWSDSVIKVKVPPDLKAGDYKVSVKNDAGTSNQTQFEVTEKGDGGDGGEGYKIPEEAIEKYCEEKGIVIPALNVDPDKVSEKDPDWEIDYGFPAEAEGEGYFFLLHKTSGGWEVIAHTPEVGWTAEQLEALGAPADLVLWQEE